MYEEKARLGLIIKRVSKKEKLLDFDQNWLCYSLKDPEMHSPLRAFLEPLYDPTHSLWKSWISSPCHFMTDHSLRHVLNVFRYATRLYYDVVQNPNNLYGDRNFLKDDADKVCLIVSIWLHDWGMIGPSMPIMPQLFLHLGKGKAREREEYIENYKEKLKDELNEIFESANKKLDVRLTRIESIDKDIDCKWIRPNHALITYFNIMKENHSIGLDKLCQKLEKRDRNLEDIATICLFHSFPPEKLKQFGKESLSGLCALLALLDGCDENWQRLMSMTDVDALASESFLEGDKVYRKINSIINSENLQLLLPSKGNVENNIRELRKAWDEERLEDAETIIGDLLKTCEDNEGELVKLKGDIRYYSESFVDKSKMHIERKLVIDDVYFRNSEIILVLRHKLISEKNPAVQKAIEQIKKHLRRYRDGLRKLGLPFTEESVRLWKPEDGDPEKLEIPEPEVIPFVNESLLCEVITYEDFQKLVKNGNFIEKPLKEDEDWKFKKEHLIDFDRRLTEDALNKLISNRILLITGSQNVGKSTFLLYLLDECLKRKIASWHTLIFLNPLVNEKDLDLLLERVDAFMQSKNERDSVLLAVDGLRRRETDENYIDKCVKLFEKASEYGYKFIATVRDNEKEYLKNRLGPHGRGVDEWARFDPKEIRISYGSKELKKILLKHLNYFKGKIELKYISYEEMNEFFLPEEEIPEREQHQQFKDCMENVVRKSEGLAGYIAFLIEEISEHEKEFSEEVVDKYPVGMINLVLNTIWRDYYIEENEKSDQLIPLLILFLMNLEYPSEFSLTEHFFDSFVEWGTEKINEKFSEENKNEIQEKIRNFIKFYTVRTSYAQECEYRLLNYWKDAVDRIIHTENYDENYAKVVNSLKKAEKDWKYLIGRYLLHIMNEISSKNFHQDMPYLVGDMAKLWNTTDIDVLDFSVEFFEKHKCNENSLPVQFNFLKQNITFSLKTKAQNASEELDYDGAIDLYKKAIDIDGDDYRSFWEVGECLEKKGEAREALDWYSKSAQKEDTSAGYGSLIDKIKNYCKRFRLPIEAKTRYIKLQEAAAHRAVECDRGDHIAWGMLGDSLLQQGNILQRRKEYQKSISKYEAALRSYKEAVSMLEKMKLPPKDLYYWQIGYCHDGLRSIFNQLREPEAQAHLKEAVRHLKLGAELENCAKGYLQLAKVMSNEDFYREDNFACKAALEKINVDELDGDDVIEYYYVCGLDHENKKELDSAINSYENARKSIFSKCCVQKIADVWGSEGKMLGKIGDICQRIGNCYSQFGDYNKAAENYTTYLELVEYTPRGLSGRIFGIFGNKLLQMGIYDKAYYCFRRALKRDPTNIQNLDQMAIVNERLGKLEYAICNLEKVIELKQSGAISEGWLLSEIEKATEKLDMLRKELSQMNELEHILEEVCNIADFANVLGGEEVRAGDLSSMFYKVHLLLNGVDSRAICANIDDFDDLRTSVCCQSFILYRNGPARGAIEEIAHACNTSIAEILKKYDVKYHIFRAQQASQSGSLILEIFNRIFATAFNTLKVADCIRKGTLRGNEKLERILRLSEEWGKTGRRISKIPVGGIQHLLAIRCFQLSVKFNPENIGSWHNLGWEYFYDSIKRGDSFDLATLEKAHGAFKKNLELEENGEKKYSHRSRIGIGKIFEAKGDATSAAKSFKEGASLCVDLYAQKDPQKTVDDLIKTADSLRDLRLLNLSKDDEIAFLRDALDLYKKALEISQGIEPSNGEASLIKEKVLLFENHIIATETRLREVEKALPALTLKPEKSLDEILSSPFKSKIEKIDDIALQITKKPDDYDLFKRVFHCEFSYFDKLEHRENVLAHTLDRLVSLSMKQARKDSPFENSAKIFHSCQIYCRDLYGEEAKREFINMFNERMILRFAKIALGIEYKIGPIKSEEELNSLLKEFGKTFGKLGAKTPSLEEINKAIEKKKF